MPRRASIQLYCRFAILVLAAVLLVACGAPAPSGDELTPAPTSPVDVPIEDLLVYVPAGHFYMGSEPELDPLAEEDEYPLHPVLLDGYFIYRNEVSNGLYKQCVEAGLCSDPQIFEDGPSTHYNDPEYKDFPVVGVNWDQAAAFCSWAEARLPTEAEWEKAARGENGAVYPWGEDEPSCALSNMAGCFVDPPDTEKVGQYPDGESEYEANDMSGNVWEWTLDWYLEDYYTQSPDANPLGPENGELRVVRGGSYEDGPEALRSAERFALDPDEAFNNVGFRCVPMGEDRAAVVQAPFCLPNYHPYCLDPSNPNDGCEPGQTAQVTGTPLPDGYDFVAIGCPDANGYVTVTIDTDGSSPTDNTVTVGGVEYNCVESTQYPNRLLCTGPHPPQGTLTDIEVCAGENAGTTRSRLVGYQPSQENGGDQLVAYAPTQQQAKPELAAYQPQQQQPTGLQAYQPGKPAGLQGYEPDDAGAPALIGYLSVTSACPTGYVYNETTGQCEQDPNGACPEGWNFNPQTNQCEPGDAGCPEGTTLAATNQGCEPTTGQECPDGYIYSASTNTCEPPSNDDGGGMCPAGYFYDREINCCSPVPSGNNGCDPGFYRSVSTNECQPYDENGCPDGYTYNRYEGACVPNTGDDDPTGDADGCRLEGYVMNDAGQCVPGETPIQRIFNACPEGTYFDENLQQCVELGDGECGLGYRMDSLTRTCVPTDGPGSGCAEGYVFSERYNCCVAGPGNGGYCPGDPADGQTGRVLTTGYDFGYGYCDPPEGQECPDGYTLNPQTGACEQATNLQRVTEAGCPEGTAYDEQLRYCAPTSCGCELGTYFDQRTNTCVPYGDEPTGGGCWSYTVSVPVCEYASPTPPVVCDRDEKYNPLTGLCERLPDNEVLTCADYSSQSACNAAGCNWYAFSTPPCF